MNATKSLAWISIALQGIALLLSFLYMFLLLADIYSDQLLIALLCLWGGCFLTSIGAVCSIVFTRTCWLALVPVLFCSLLSGLVIYAYAELDAGFRMRAEYLHKVSVDSYLMHLRNAMFKYTEYNSGYLPDANHWCDQLMSRDNVQYLAHIFIGRRERPSIWSMEVFERTKTM